MARKIDYSGDLKVNIFVLGAVILGLGLHSYIASAWMSKSGDATFCEKGKTVFGYEVCDSHKFLFEKAGKACPSISMERYFISIIIITFVISLASCLGPFRASSDVIYHGIGSVLLLVAGIVYIVSALQIDDIFKWLECKGDTEENRKLVNNDWVDYCKSEKLVAGILTIIQSILFAMMAHLKSMEVRSAAERQPLVTPIAVVSSQRN